MVWLRELDTANVYQMLGNVGSKIDLGLVTGTSGNISYALFHGSVGDYPASWEQMGYFRRWNIINGMFPELVLSSGTRLQLIITRYTHQPRHIGLRGWFLFVK